MSGEKHDLMTTNCLIDSLPRLLAEQDAINAAMRAAQGVV